MITTVLRKAYHRVFSYPGPERESIYLAQNKRYSSYKIGEWTYGTPVVISWNHDATFVVGRFCSIAENVTILLGGEHRTDWVTTYPFNVLFEDAKEYQGHPRTKGDVIIGSDVWIGRDALMLSGVVVGNGAVIAARSVVTKDVAPYSIVAGNPARHIRSRFPQHLVDALQLISWWDWPLDKIREAWPLLLSTNIEEFVNKYLEGYSPTPVLSGQEEQ
jgi:acetyltransferase-like isoleucine patch superfamily enzyme